MAGTWSLGKVACVGGNAHMWGALGGPTRSLLQVLGRHPPGINPRALHALAEGVCLQSGCSWLFVFTFHLQPKPQDRKNKSHGGQVHIGHRERSTLGTSSLLKAGKDGLFSSQVLSSPPARAMQTNGETAQVRRPSEWPDPSLACALG